VMSFTRSHGVTISGAPLPVGAQPFLRVEESGPGAITLEGSVPGNIELGAGVSADAVVRR